MKKIVLAITTFVLAVVVLHNYKNFRKQMDGLDSYNSVVIKFNECFEAFDWKCSEMNLLALLKESPEDTVLRINMAVVLLEQERYDECVAFVDSLEGSRKDKSLAGSLVAIREKASLLQREMEELRLEKSFHFRLEYDGHPSRQNVMEALAVLEVAYDSISTLFQFEPENKLCVVLHQASDFNGVGPRPDWVGAVYDGKLRIPENLMHFNGVYRPVLFHELTHSFVRGMTHGNIPLWINEGIAQVVDASRNDVTKPAGAKPNLKELSDSFVKHDDRDMAEKLYWYSQKMVEGMLRRNGSFVNFRDFVSDLNKLGEKESLKKFYNVTAEQLLEEVR